MRRILAALSIAGLIGVGARAQIDRPSHARRVVRVFTFEERQIHDAPVPLHWFRAQHNPPTRVRPAYPIWNRATLEYEGAYEGQGCVRLPSKGGSTALRLESGVVPVLPGAEYSVRAMVRGIGLRSGQVGISARFLDARGEALDPARGEFAVRQSMPDERWRGIELALSATPDDAAFLQIDLEQVQPSEGGREVYFRDDLTGSAWFDDVSVVMRPRMTLRIGEGGALRRGVHSAEVTLSVRDLAGGDLRIRLRAFDLDGRVVDQQIVDADPSGRTLTWRPTLARFGWYRVEATLLEDGRAIARRTADVARLPEREAGRERANVGMIAPQGTEIHGLAALAERAGLDRVMIPAWGDDLADGGSGAQRVEDRVEELAGVVSDLRERGVRVAVSIDRVPQDAVRATLIDPRDVGGWIVGGDGSLGVFLEPFLQRLGQSVDTWGVGSVESGSVGGSRDTADVAGVMGRLVAGVRVVSRVPIESLGGGSSAGAEAGQVDARRVLLVTLDPSVRDEALGELGDDLGDSLDAAQGEESSGDERPTSWLSVRPLSVEVFGARESAGEIVRRLALARVHMGDAEFLLDDATVAGESPAWVSPALVALAHAGDRLAGMRAVAEFEPVAGTHAVLFEAGRVDDPGVIVAWADDAYEPREMRMMLSLGGVRVVDMFGNASEIEAGASDVPGLREHRVELSRSPVFVEGVDTALVRFQTEFSIEPSRLVSDDSTHEHAIHMTNPWTSPIRARYFLVRPGEALEDGTRDRSWTISPRAGEVALGPGESAERAMSVAMTPFQPEGEVEAVLDVELDAGRKYGLVRLRAPMRVGIEDLRAAVHVDRSGSDGVVVVTLANLSERTRDLEIVVFAEAGGVRQRTVVSGLAGEQIAVRRLAFDANAIGSRLFVSIMDGQSGEHLNRIVELAAGTLAVVTQGGGP